MMTATERGEQATARHRSPSYPAVSLKEALNKLRLLYDRAKRTPVGDAAAVAAMGYGALSGSARVLLSALRKYGLIEDHGGNVRVSDLGLRILMHQEGSAERDAAIREAAFKPEIIRELSATYGDVSNEVLRPHLLI